MDESGEIRATAFNAAAVDFYDRLQDGKVYLISKAKVGLAKKKFSNVNNEYELTLERNTEVEECADATDVPAMKFNFVSIGNLQDVAKDSTIDVIGVVKEVGELSSITSKATSKVIPKRELTIVDRSGFSVRLTLWGKQAEQYDSTDQPVIAFKGAKVGDFQGRSLSMMSSSTMHVDPDIPEAHALRGWYDAAPSDQKFQSHTGSMPSGGGVAFDRAEIRNLNDVKVSELGMYDKPDYFSARATVMHIKSDNISYPACPTQGCVSDYSGQAWFQGFNDVGQLLFGMSADELVDIKVREASPELDRSASISTSIGDVTRGHQRAQERDDVRYNQVMERTIGTTYNFACRARQDTYNDQTRVRYGISRIMPLNYREEAKYLANLLLTSEWAR
ncbi:replication protein A [Ganoderma sinense ZZ0214-1]|uniref:Replication protein A subunit n=1 Tax=Ganoderma sinense ZZ0214-1 TaxID=1077348 RepID=A0A2G8RRX6_9APHY|nr:replication protein A [Ganoderma sinense ZZ0214-1]